MGGQNLVRVRVRIVVAAIFDFVRLGSTLRVGARAKEGKEGGGEEKNYTLLFSLPADSPLPPCFLCLAPFLLSSGSFNMALSRAKTFAHPKKTPALQVSHHDTDKRIALKVSSSPNLQLPKCSVRSRGICVVW